MNSISISRTSTPSGSQPITSWLYSAVTIIPSPILGPTAQSVICPSCRSPITTEVKAETTTKTHFIALLLCLVGCCCLPYCIDSCKARNHYCTHCNAFLGTYN
ncbi:hypothetical protein RI129_009135 [Pyrocoelia pectoralis]|uniref:LITAF domain-containing protein n=1 Tax=Pyrocoelia pectoralis TaxID=417401 RepID=A0AAN7ZKS2_9COLE